MAEVTATTAAVATTASAAFLGAYHTPFLIAAVFGISAAAAFVAILDIEPPLGRAKSIAHVFSGLVITVSISLVLGHLTRLYFNDLSSVDYLTFAVLWAFVVGFGWRQASARVESIINVVFDRLESVITLDIFRGGKK